MILKESLICRTVLYVISVCLINSTVLARYNGGTGGPDDPYLIASAEDLELLRHNPMDWDKHFKLKADINLSGQRFDDNVIPWFSGSLDGQGHIIHNFVIRSRFRDVRNSSDLINVGFFGRLELGSILTRFGLERVNINGINATYNIGGLAGQSAGSIISCYHKGSIVGETCCIGGLVGENLASGIIRYCHNTGTISGGLAVGGLVGKNSGGITASYSTGEVGKNIVPSVVGGLVGENSGNIITSYSNGKVSGDNVIGGLVGDNSNGTISFCYSASKIVDYGVLSSGRLIGGLVGNNGTMYYNPYTDTHVNNYGIISISFWDTVSSDRSNISGNTGLSENSDGKATAEMQIAKTFIEAGWDFTNEEDNGTEDIWWIFEGQDYPRLWWEKYCEGAGEPNDPYLIYSAAHLHALGAEPNDWDKHFELTSDVDLVGYVYDRALIAPDVNALAPGFQGIPFTGSFTGNGHTISGLTIDSESYLGLFGQMDFGADVNHLGLIDVNIIGSGDYIGALVGFNNHGHCTMTYSTGQVRGDQRVGGLMGRNWGDLSQSYSSAMVVGRSDAGGLTANNYANITNCYSTGAVTANLDAGGLVGENYGHIFTSYSTGEVSASTRVSGLVAYNWSEATVNASLWDKETSKQATSDGGTGLTTLEMNMADTFIGMGWDFVGEADNGSEDTWWIKEGQGYPKLWWEIDMP